MSKTTLEDMSRTPPRKGGPRANPRLISQLEAAIERGESVEEALLSIGARNANTQRLYIRALTERGESPYDSMP